jgi:hypothetical protein
MKQQQAKAFMNDETNMAAIIDMNEDTVHLFAHGANHGNQLLISSTKMNPLKKKKDEYVYQHGSTIYACGYNKGQWFMAVLDSRDNIEDYYYHTKELILKVEDHDAEFAAFNKIKEKYPHLAFTIADA